MVYFNFPIFCYCFWIFNYASGRNGTERWFLFSPFLLFIKPILAWKEYRTVFFKFLNFFDIFLGFSISRRVGTKRNDNFYILSFTAFYNLFSLEIKAQWYILIFLNFFAIFLEFSFTRRVGTKGNNNFYFLCFSSLSNLFLLEMTP